MINPGLIAGGASLIGDAIGMIGQKKRENRALKNQTKLMGIQKKNQMELNEQGYDLQKRMWDETNYQAQMNNIKGAGLNAGLIYGMKGGGGVTTGSQGGGSAQGGNAPSPQPMEIGNKMQAVAQLALLNAQRKNIEADTFNKLKSGDNQYEQSEEKRYKNIVTKQYGLDAELYEASNRKDAALVEGQYKYEGNTGKDDVRNKAFDMEDAKYRNAINEADIKEVEARIAKETEEDVKNKIAYEAASTQMDKAVKEQQINLSKEQERKIWHDIWTNWTNAGFNGLGKIINAALIKNLKSIKK